jgi:nicotinamide-nucleotide amidase
VFVGLSGPGLLEAVALELTGRRHQVQDRTVQETLEAFEAVLRREETRLG